MRLNPQFTHRRPQVDFDSAVKAMQREWLQGLWIGFIGGVAVAGMVALAIYVFTR